MSTTPEAPALIQYACERCKTRFVLPPSSHGLSLGGKLRAFTMSLGRAIKLHEGLGAGYDTARRQLLAKMDDEAYQSFVQSFRFCHECRQFVCNECWSTSRRSCLTCVAKSMTGAARPRPPFAPTGPEIPRPVVTTTAPRRGRLRRDLALVAAAIAVILVSIEGGVLLVNAVSDTGGAAPTDNGIAAVTSPTNTTSPSPTAMPTPSPTATPTPSPTATPTPSPTDTPMPSPSLSPSLSLAPTPTPTPKPKPTPVPPLNKPTFKCTTSGTTATCTTNATYYPKDKSAWYVDSAYVGAGSRTKSGQLQLKYDFGTEVYHFVQVVVSRSGTASQSATGSPW